MNKPINVSSTRHLNPAVFGGVSIAFAGLAFAVWASLAPLNGAVVSLGLVKTEQNRKAVQHSEGGIVKKIWARDGDIVKAGQPIIELENVATDASHRLLRELTAIETLKRDRFDAEQQLALHFPLDRKLSGMYGDDVISAAYQRELKIFKARRTSLDQQTATLNDQLRAIELERSALNNQIKADKESIRLAEEELTMNRSLEAQKFVSRTRVMAHERNIADYRSRLGEHEANHAQMEQRGNDVKLRMAALRNEYQRLATEEYKESNSRLIELRERLRPAEDALQRKLVLAPVSGRVIASRYHAPGQVIGPRDILAEVVPDQETMILEGQISVDGIGDVKLDQAADIRFTAFKSRVTPIVTGKVVYVSADALADKNGIPFYRLHVRPDPDSMKRAGISQIQPGMAAEIFILTEGRSTLDYLLAPVVDSLRHSMRER